MDALTEQASAHGLQEAAVADAQARAHGLLLAGEQVRLALVTAGADYRTLFAWLLTTIRRLNEEPSALGGAAAHRASLRTDGFQFDALRMAAFLQAQFEHDNIGSHLAPDVRAAAALACSI